MKLLQRPPTCATLKACDGHKTDQANEPGQVFQCCRLNAVVTDFDLKTSQCREPAQASVELCIFAAIFQPQFVHVETLQGSQAGQSLHMASQNDGQM